MLNIRWYGAVGSKSLTQSTQTNTLYNCYIDINITHYMGILLETIFFLIFIAIRLQALDVGSPRGQRFQSL